MSKGKTSEASPIGVQAGVWAVHMAEQSASRVSVSAELRTWDLVGKALRLCSDLSLAGFSV